MGDDNADVSVPRSDPCVGSCVPPPEDFGWGTANERSDPRVRSCAAANRRSDPFIAIRDGGDSTIGFADAWTTWNQARPAQHNLTLAEAYYVLIGALLQDIIRGDDDEVWRTQCSTA